MTSTAPKSRTQALIEALLTARAQRTQLRVADWAGAAPTAAEIEAIQRGVAAALGGPAQGQPKYWKAGGATRDDASITESPLPANTVLTAPVVQPGSAEPGVDARSLWLPQGGVEAEIALRLGRDIDQSDAAALRPGQAWGLVDAMCISIELTASRWDQGSAAPKTLRDADLQTHGALLLGPWLPAEPQRDWSRQVCDIRINAGVKTELRCIGSHSLVDPGWLLPAWLRHITREGQTVAAGTVVTTGSWVGNLPLAAGDHAEVVFDGLGRLAVQA